jgi:drug/metabolite transporter (DMT)-like permease
MSENTASAGYLQAPGAAGAEAEAARLARRRRYIGIGLVLLATLGWSLSGLGMRLLEEPVAGRTNGWRALFMAVALTLWLLWHHRGGVPALFRATPPLAILLGGGFFTVGSTLSLTALAMAPVADVSCISATAPLFAAVFARIFLGERTPPAVLLAVVVAISGIVFMVADQLALDGGAWAGQLVSLGVGFCFAGQTVALRKFRGVEMMPAFVVGGLLTAAIMIGLAGSEQPSLHDLGIIVVLGFVQLAMPICCYARGARYLPAVQLALIALLDVVFNPFWAWLAVGETPTLDTVIGGGMIVLAVAWVALRQSRR